MWETPKANVGPEHRINVIISNYYDILPARLQKLPNVTAEDTQPLFEHIGKFGYVVLKKLLMAFYFDYDWALWMDAEAIAVRPFSMVRAFRSYAQSPVVLHSRMSKSILMRRINAANAVMLGRSMDSFGQLYWSMESLGWYIEKKVAVDLIQWIEDTHGQDFISVVLDMVAKHAMDVFEANLFAMHIQARKLETVDSIYSKYQVLEVERAMLRFGMGELMRPHGTVPPQPNTFGSTCL